MMRLPNGWPAKAPHPQKSGTERPFHKILAYLTWLQGHCESPGGVNCCIFFLSSPEEPPSSATVTMAAISTSFFPAGFLE